MNKIIRKRFISLGLRSILMFITGSVILTNFLIFSIRYDPFFGIILSLVVCWLFLCLLLFSFSTLVFKKEYIKIRGDFSLSDSQIQKKTIIKYCDIKSLRFTNLKEHTNSAGETLKFTYKYGNERMIIYGMSSLKCIEIELNDRIERIIINKYTKKQADNIFKIIENNSHLV
jgi:hypothetical protein